MNKSILGGVLLAFTISAMSVHPSEENTPVFKWKKHIINAESRFEAAGIGDINNDGKKDIVCGEYWYEAPSWTPHKIAEIEEQHDYFNDFANELQDVDGDGDLDIVSCTWFSKEIYWRENPGDKEGLWPRHSVDTPGNMETGYCVDINGDGRDDFFPNISSELAWYTKRDPSDSPPHWTKCSLGKNGAGHGGGIGDLNGDGVFDIITPTGWHEGKKNGTEMSWTWHPEFQLGVASIPVLAHDVNQDGLNDIVWGMGHDYGVYWLEQKKEDGKRTWEKHLIDKSWSQAHYIWLSDLNADGKTELITGKRYHAHNGKDPGGNDPLCIYVYSYDKNNKEWNRHTVDAGTKAGFGLNAAIDDIDNDGDQDLVCPGKSGLYLFEQQ